MDRAFDLVIIGDSTIDTFIRIQEATVEFDINHKEGKLCVKYGSKIPVDEIAHSVAGNAANVAVACCKLGLKTAIYTNLGDDDHGSRIKEAFKKNGVSSDFVKVNSKKTSNLSVVLSFQGERTIFVYHQPWNYNLPELPVVPWVYLTSMAETFTNSNIMDEVFHYVVNNKAKLVFAPGTYQLKVDIKRYPHILEICELLIVNMEEARKIIGTGEGEVVSARDVLDKLILLGPKVVVVTDGQEGSYASDGRQNYKMGVFPTIAIDKTGAGDAYASGFVSALSQEKSLEEAMIWGTINASGVMRVIGPQNGLMSRDEVQKYLRARSEIKVSKF